VSGETAYSGAIVHPAMSGARWLTGGAYGPEGSVLSLLARVAIIALIIVATRHHAKARAAGQAAVTSPVR
jgi:hypothetical protein